MSDLLSVLSLGRSGSTFLQRLLNTHPSIALLGEHAGFITDLVAAHRKLADPRTAALIDTGRRYLPAIFEAEPITSSPGGWSSEWTNAFTGTDSAAGFATLIKDLIYPRRVRSGSHLFWGFKEIRYGRDEVAFLASLFPTSRFILLLRNPVEVYHSQCRLHWGRHRGPARAAEDFHRNLRRLQQTWQVLRADDLAPRARMIRYDQLVEDPIGQVDRIAEWLGIAPFQPDAVRSVAAAQLSPHLAADTPEVEAFLRAYTSRYAKADLARYAAMAAADVRPSHAARGLALGGTAPQERGGPAAAPPLGAPARLAVARHTGKRILFLHIPGTCGTTLHDEIAGNYEPGEVLLCRTSMATDLAPARLQRYRFISGHFDMAEIDRIPGETYVFTVLCDPVQRLRVLCRTWSEPAHAGLRRGGPLRSAAASLLQELDNGMARRLAGRVGLQQPGLYVVRGNGVRRPVPAAHVVRMALRNLRRFDFVGDTRSLDLAYARIAHDVGLSQASGALACSPGPRPAQQAPCRLSAGDVAQFTQMDRIVYDHVRNVLAADQ